MGSIYETLAQIVGDEYVSNRREELYFYGRDPSLMVPHEPDYVRPAGCLLAEIYGTPN